MKENKNTGNQYLDATDKSKKEIKIFKLFRPGTLPDWLQRRSVGRRLRRK